MVKFGIISDTHVKKNDDPSEVKILLDKIKQAFKDVDEILHAGDLSDIYFLNELNKIAPTRCVVGNTDDADTLENFMKFSIGKYNIGLIHVLPDDLEQFFKENDLHILIYGHTHQPLMKGLPYNVLILNPGSPTRPKAPPPKRGFKEPIARKTVMTLEIDEEDDTITTFIINI